MKRLVFFVIAVLTLAADAAAQQPVLVVRHAERADAGTGGATMMGTDPGLSDIGRARAQSLATALKDTGITAIFVTEYKRTQQTAEPLAKSLGIQPTVVTAKDVQGLVKRVRAASGPILIIGHSNTIPEILGKLGVETPPKLADSDYDDLFVVSRADKSVLIRLHYR